MLKLLGMLFAAGKLGKVLTTGGTMIVSVLAYALVWGLPYAFGLVVLIFVHEMGHFLAARRRGLEVGAPTFIPFVGAWVAMKDMPRDVETEAYIGLAGPVVGTLGANYVWVIGHTSQVSPDLEMPLWLVYLCIPCGSYLMCFRFLQVAWTFARTGDLPHHDASHVEGVETIELPDEQHAPDPLHPAPVPKGIA